MTEKSYPIVRAYLSKVREAKKEIEKLQFRLENLKMLLTDTSVHRRDMPCNRSADPQKIEAVYAEIDEVEREIAAAEEMEREIRTEVGITICRMDNPIVQRVLILHYLEGKSWRDIATEINFSLTQVCRYRDIGYRELEKRYTMEQKETRWRVDGNSIL